MLQTVVNERNIKRQSTINIESEYLSTPMAVMGVGFSPAFVCPHDILQTDAARITKLDTEMFHQDSKKSIYSGEKRSKV